MDNKYDVGIYGLWYGNNYGSIMTYYALKKTVESMGLSVVMIKNPLGEENINLDELRKSHPLRFAKEHYDITPLYRLSQMGELNKICNSFLLGSDQMWNYGLSKPYKQSYFLDFAADEKRKISYATSFGRETYTGPADEKEITKASLSRFHHLSVRDDFSQKICKEEFGVHADIVMDPVFLCPMEEYEKLIANVSLKREKDYIFVYVLDPNPIIGAEIKKISDSTGLNVLVAFNESCNQDEAKRLLSVIGGKVRAVGNITAQEWLYYFKNAQYVLTDSFHGACFSILFEKQFIVLRNNKRGGERFPILLQPLNLLNRMINNPRDFYETFSAVDKNIIDYKTVNEIIIKEKFRSLEWLRNALFSKQSEMVPAMVEPLRTLSQIKQNDSIQKITSNEDFIKVKLLVTLLRDYGIRHIVMSPGGRTILLSQMFEHNSNNFSLHFCSEERSAGYFAMGLASKFHAPVAMMCTSGTAASNYMPAITEAFYTGIPLIAITADRYQVFLNQNEDQMISQLGMFDQVTKKSCNLINASGVYSAIEHRRKISECILECTHNGLGPVHINVPIQSIEIGMNAPEEVWKLPTKIYPHISRLTQSDEENRWEKWIKALRESKRILIIYGQNNPPSAELQRDIERFANKYNCVISTDHISNLHCDYSVHSYYALKQINQEYFNKELSPSILISVGGHRIMNDPLIGKIRRGLQSIRHWSVMPGGEICDTYFKLTTVIECSQAWFFKYFAEHAGEIQNDGEFYKKWERAVFENSQYQVKKYNHLYALCHLMGKMPKHSLFHLGVGATFIDAQKFPLDSSIEVFCNMGTNGIDGGISTFMGQVEATKEDTLCFLAIGDLSFFYDMNGIWNKNLKPNIRIMMINNSGSALLRGKQSINNRASHSATAKGWVKSLGFEYMSATSKEEFEANLERFIDPSIQEPIFFEVFVQ